MGLEGIAAGVYERVTENRKPRIGKPIERIWNSIYGVDHGHCTPSECDNRVASRRVRQREGNKKNPGWVLLGGKGGRRASVGDRRIDTQAVLKRVLSIIEIARGVAVARGSGVNLAVPTPFLLRLCGRTNRGCSRLHDIVCVFLVKHGETLPIISELYRGKVIKESFRCFMIFNVYGIMSSSISMILKYFIEHTIFNDVSTYV